MGKEINKNIITRTGDVKTNLIIKTMEYELKIIELENKYKIEHPTYDEKKMAQYVKKHLEKHTKELLHINLNPAFELTNS